MDNAWTWLKRANARAVCIGAIVALVVVMGWSTWRVLAPLAGPAPIAPPPRPEPEQAGMSLLEILSRERAVFTNQTARNPFQLPDSLMPKIDPVEIKPSVPRQTSTVAVAVSPPPKPAPRREPITLKYRGSMRRGDGTLTALIEDSRSRRATFYPAGTNVCGLTIRSIADDAVIVANGNEIAPVRRGATVSFEDKAHDD